MTTRTIAERILNEMGGDAEEICNGSCTVYAVKLIDELGKGQIVSNLDSSMLEEIEGYEIIEPQCSISKPCARNRFMTSHCWVKVDGKFYDAFNPEGCDEEHELEFVQQSF